MKTYKAIVIDGKKLIKNFILLILLAGILSVPIVTIITNDDSKRFSAEDVIGSVIPSVNSISTSTEQQVANAIEMFRLAVVYLAGFDMKQPQDIIAYQVPVLSFIGQNMYAAKTSEGQGIYSTFLHPYTDKSKAEAEEIPEENRAPIKAIDLSPDKKDLKKIVIGNETSYSVNIDEMLAAPLNIDMTAEGPKILIIHTHATESYSAEGSSFYDKTKGSRSRDNNRNMIKIGAAAKEVFDKKGIEVIHDTQLHDYPSFNGSYAHSLAAIEEYVKKYPSIQIVLDLHRDSIIYSDDTSVKPLVQIQGKPAAQLMIVVGTDQNGLYNPQWRDRLKTAIHFQNAINNRYPGLMRHINLRKERFNGHATPGSMIIETGAEGNSLSEAEYGIRLAAECIAEYLLDK